MAVRKVATPLREFTCHMGSHSLPPKRGDIPTLTPTGLNYCILLYLRLQYVRRAKFPFIAQFELHR